MRSAVGWHLLNWPFWPVIDSCVGLSVTAVGQMVIDNFHDVAVRGKNVSQP